MAAQLMKAAIDKHDVDQIRDLLKDGYDVSRPIDNEEGASALHYACKHRHFRPAPYDTMAEYTCTPNDPANISVITILLSSPTANVNQQSIKTGKTALHLLARSRCTTSTAVKLLLDHGADADIKSKYPKGFTALHLALRFSHVQWSYSPVWDREVVPLLIDKTSNMTGEVGEIGETALHIAAENWNEEIINAILDKGALVDSRTQYLETPLHYAAHSHNTAAIRALLTRGADVNALSSLTLTPLHSAAVHVELDADPNAVVTLLEGGAQVNTQTRLGWTALHLVFLYSWRGFTTIAVTALLQYGADVSLVASTTYKSAFDWLSYWHGGCESIPLIFRPKSPAIPLQQTPLHWAVACMLKSGHSHVELQPHLEQEPLELTPIRRLIEANANINATDENGFTPLHLSVDVRKEWAYGHTLYQAMWLTQYLLLQGADKDAKNGDGETAVDLTKSQYIQMVLEEFQPGDVGGEVMWKWDEKFPPPYVLIPI